MGLFDSIMGKLGNDHADVDNLATKLGISPQVAEEAIMALARAHQQPGDTVATAAAETGHDPSLLDKVLREVGGHGSLTEFAALLK